MTVELVNYTPLYVASKAIRTCWESDDNSDSCEEIRTYNLEGDITTYEEKVTVCGEKDRDLIHRVGNKFKHSSTLEHLTYNFHIKGVSRGLLQELARHRMASPSVKSTRYTLKELKKEPKFVKGITYNPRTDDYKYILTRDSRERAKKYIVFTGDEKVDGDNIVKLDMLRIRVKEGTPNDISKYSLPECYKTTIAWTINARSLQNFLQLRTSTSALWEIRLLAVEIFEKLPDEHKYLFEELIYKK